MTETTRRITIVQFDVGQTRRFQLLVNGAVLPTVGLSCQGRLQRVDDDGAPFGTPVTFACAAVADDFWEWTITSALTGDPGEYQFEARIDNGAGEIKRFPDRQHNVVVVRPVRTGGTA